MLSGAAPRARRQRPESVQEKIRQFLSILLPLSILGMGLWFYAVVLSADRNTPTAPLAAALLIAVNYILIQKATQSDPLLRSVLRTAYLYKLAAVGTFIVVLLAIYKGGDALFYHRAGANHAVRFWEFGQLPSLFADTGAHFVGRLTGLVYVLLGKSFAVGMLAFGSLAFWGSYFYLKMYREVFPNGNILLPAFFVLFFPSVTFWTASIGKDSAIFFSIGLFGLAFARLSAGFSGTYLAFLLATLFGTAFIRPHIALMLALSAATALVLARGLPGIPQRVSRLIGLALLLAGITRLLPMVQQFLQLENLSLASTKEFLEWQLRVTAKGGSAFTSDSLSARLLLAPLSLVRPFPWEAHNFTAAIASLEGTFFAFAVVNWRHNLLANLRNLRTNIVALFVVLFVVQFVFAFSSVANFGILSRQRVMLLPWLFMLFSSPTWVTAGARSHQSQGRANRTENLQPAFGPGPNFGA